MKPTVVVGVSAKRSSSRRTAPVDATVPHPRFQAPSALRRAFAPESLVPTYAGIATVLLGFGLIALAWSRVAALTNVALQMPYVISAGFTGLALVMSGLLAVNIAVKRQQAAERARQLTQLIEAVRELRDTVAEERHPG